MKNKIIRSDRTFLLITLVDDLFVHIYNEVKPLKEFADVTDFLDTNMNNLFSIKDNGGGKAIYDSVIVNRRTGKPEKDQDISHNRHTNHDVFMVDKNDWKNAIKVRERLLEFPMSRDPLNTRDKMFPISRDLVRCDLGIRVLLNAIKNKVYTHLQSVE